MNGIDLIHTDQRFLAAGQNLRYSGNAFKGFKRSQPYMTFVNYVNHYQMRVLYNGREIVVNSFLTEPVG